MSNADVAIAFARAQMGKPYKFGATGPNSYDCSGLTQASWKAGGVSIGRVTQEQITDGVPVSAANLLPGDLVFPEITHVQLYVGNNRVIQAPHSGAFVEESALGHVMTARRVGTPGSDEGLTGGTGSIIDVGNPVTDTLSSLSEIKKLVDTLSDVQFWKRAGMFVFAAILIVISLAFFNRGQIASTVKKAVI